MTPAFTPRIVLKTSRFRLPDRTLLYSRARLFPDRLELLALAPSGWHRERIVLAGVAGVECTEPEAGLVLLHLRDGTLHRVGFDRAGEWQRAIEARLPWTATPGRRAYAAPDLALPDLVAYVTSMS